MLRRFAPILLLTACAADPHLSEDSDAITDEGATPASTFYHWRAIKTAGFLDGGCTATRISARYALTAAHCLGNDMRAEVNEDDVSFYPYGAFNPSGLGTIRDRDARVNVDACRVDHDDCYDDGKLADIALLRFGGIDEEGREDLRSYAESDEYFFEGPQATLAWNYPGANAVGVAVGNGEHNGQENPNGTLKQTSSKTDSSNDDDGEFDTEEGETNDGDSGGPFYAGEKVVGVLSGSASTYGLYTSVPYYIHWVLTKMGYRWRGQPSQSDTVFVGDIIESSVNSETTCQYACEKTPACAAYNWKDATSTSPKSCGLISNPSPASTQAGWRGGLKAGRVGTSGAAVGYVRGDGTHAIVHVSNNNRIKELALVGGVWKPYDIHGGAAAVGTPRITAIRRSDGTSAVYYRANTGVIFEVALSSDGWHSYPISITAGAPLAAGAPVAYVRGDGVTAVVYRSTGNHIIELRLGSRGWISTDLNFKSSSGSVVVSSDPSVSVRADGTNSIVFRAGSHIWELYQSNTADVVAGIGAWKWGVPTQLTDNPTAPPPAESRPVGYSHRGGIFAIVYRSTSDQIIEVWLDGLGWHWGVLASGAKGDPTAFTRTDGREAVLYRNASNQIMQAYNANGWSTLNLSTVTGVSGIAGDPYVYQRADGYNSVLFETNTGHVNELWYKRGQGNWAGGDITAGVGETP